MLTAARLELLRYVHCHEVVSVRALAEALARDDRSVQADVAALIAAGLLLDATESGLRADFDAIETKIAI